METNNIIAMVVVFLIGIAGIRDSKNILPRRILIFYIVLEVLYIGLNMISLFLPQRYPDGIEMVIVQDCLIALIGGILVYILYKKHAYKKALKSHINKKDNI